MATPSWHQFLLGSLLICSTTVVPMAIGKLVVPLDWYSFRSWEVLLDTRPSCFSEGPFYPNTYLSRTEVGILGLRTRYAIDKPVKWYTDAHGFRNRAVQDGQAADIVIVGASNIAGSGLTQEDTIAEVLAVSLDATVHAFAPGRMHEFLSQERYRAQPPGVVVFATDEVDFEHLEPLPQRFGEEPLRGPDRSLAEAIYCRSMPESLSRVVDRIKKKPLLSKHLYAMLTRQIPYSAIQGVDRRTLFFSRNVTWATLYHATPTPFLRHAVTVLTSFYRAVSQRGMRFIVLPIPSKESIYWDNLPEQMIRGVERPDFLTRLTGLLREHGIEVVDLESAYRDASARGILTYHLDDHHWNAEGVVIAAERVKARLLQNEEAREPATVRMGAGL